MRSKSLVAVILVATITALSPVAFAGENKQRESKNLIQFDKGHPKGEVEGDKALIYVLRPTTFGAGVKSFFFSDESVLGINKGSSYFFSHVSPGRHLFWSKSENVDAVELEVEAGKTYYIQQHVQMGGFKARTHIEVLDEGEGRKRLADCKKHGSLTGKGKERGEQIAATHFKKAQEEFKKKVEEASYLSPGGNFTVLVPSGVGMKFNDVYDKQSDAGAVSFHDDAGSLTAIHYMNITRLDGTVPSFQDAASRQEALKDWLHDIAMPAWFLAASPDSEVLAEAPISFEEMDALVALVEIPQGSNWEVWTAKGSERSDSRRGLVVFFRDEYIYMLAIETLVMGLWDHAPPEPKEIGNDWMEFVKDLEPFYETINFVDLEKGRATTSSVSPAELEAALGKLGREGDATDFKALLARGLDVNARDRDRRTPLMAAASAGDSELVRVLLERGADVNARNRNNSTSLMFAVLGGYLEVVRLLLEADADVNVHNEHGFTALMASEHGDPAVMRTLLAGGADIEAKDKTGATALIGAAVNGYLPAVKLLLEAGADINVRTNDGETALSLAIKQRHTEIVELLKNAEG